MKTFKKLFEHYPVKEAPFMHAMLADYQARKPLKGYSIAHNVPLTQTTLLKIACLKAAGAELTITNPSFMLEDPATLQTLESENITFLPLPKVKGRFDFLLDCGAELVEHCQARHGIVELTRTGAMRYEQYEESNVPIVSVDNTRLKSLETCLGTGEGVYRAITQLSAQKLDHKKLLVFGFGKVGIGIAYYFSNITSQISVVDMLPSRLELIEQRGYTAIDGSNNSDVEAAITNADIIVTATGVKDLISNSYAKALFTGKILANAGAEDEFGYHFTNNDILADKRPVNFALAEPTLMPFLDPIFYAHNIAIHDALNDSKPGFRPLNLATDNHIVTNWASHHGWELELLDQIF